MWVIFFQISSHLQFVSNIGKRVLRVLEVLFFIYFQGFPNMLMTPNLLLSQHEYLLIVSLALKIEPYDVVTNKTEIK